MEPPLIFHSKHYFFFSILQNIPTRILGTDNQQNQKKYPPVVLKVKEKAKKYNYNKNIKPPKINCVKTNICLRRGQIFRYIAYSKFCYIANFSLKSSVTIIHSNGDLEL